MDTKKEKTAPLFDRMSLCVALGFALILGAMTLSNVFVTLDNRLRDQMFRWRGMAAGDPRVIIVALDDASIKVGGQFPWPRSAYSKILDRLFSYGTKVVGLDIMFFEPSYPREDQSLIGATRRWGERVVHSAAHDPNQIGRNVFQFPFPALRKVTKSIGQVDQFLIDSDGLVRRSVLMGGVKTQTFDEWPHDPERIPSLGLRVLSVYEGKSVDEYLRGRRSNNIIVLNIRGQEERRVGVSRDAAGQAVALNQVVYGIRRIGASGILRGDLSEEERKLFKGSMVLLGSTSLGYYDHFPSPFNEQAPGVEVHANVIDNLLNRRELSPVPPWVTLGLILALSFLSAAALSLPPLEATLVALGAFLAWMAANYILFLRLTALDFTAPGLALLGPFSVLLVRKTLSEVREKKFIKATFGQYVAPEVVDILVKDPSKIRLGGEKRDMTVFFLDIAHFTTISEKMAPEALIQFLNHYLTALTDIVLKHRGVVDKYIGDCIMAFWNAPLDEPNHRELACNAAVECIQAVERLNREYMDPAMPEKPAIRIGLNSGVMVVGNTGSSRKLAYTVLGDEVNLASRLEGANKFFGSRIMVSEMCFSGADGAVEARELGRVRVVGKAVAIRVYELLAKKEELPAGWQKALPVYRDGIARFAKRDFEGAKNAFAEVLRHVPDDPPSKLYLNACEDYAQIPPPDDWDGVFNLTAK